MSSGNINMRDPVMYRIIHADHHRTGDKWCIYPMYDWAHGQSDSLENITHSICTIEYEHHRPLYDWFVEKLGIYAPQQIEFAPFNMTFTVLSKRRLIQLVQEGHVNGWDDPRMPTIAGMRRRGITAEALKTLHDTVGVSKVNSMVEIALFEHAIRQDLNKTSPRVMGVLDPLKVVITNYPEGEVDMLEAVNNPEDESAGTRLVPFTREIYIERYDFMEEPHKKFYRLFPGNEVRLRYAYLMTCTDVIKDKDGNVVEVHCEVDPESRGGSAPDGRRVRGTIHWVSAEHALDAEVRVYDRLFTVLDPLSEAGDFKDYLNPNSLEVITGKIEPSVKDAAPGTRYQFERKGYYVVDPDSTPENLVFNLTIPLRDTWSKIEKQLKRGKK
jgi:glutaminyl-tRNA synthetase